MIHVIHMICMITTHTYIYIYYIIYKCTCYMCILYKRNRFLDESNENSPLVQFLWHAYDR